MTIQYNCNYDGTIPFSDTAYTFALATGVAQSQTIPGNETAQYQALFSYVEGSNVFVRLNSAPTAPLSGTKDDEQYSEFRPDKRYVRGGDVVYFVTPDANGYVGMSLRKLQG